MFTTPVETQRPVPIVTLEIVMLLAVKLYGNQFVPSFEIYHWYDVVPRITSGASVNESDAVLVCDDVIFTEIPSAAAVLVVASKNVFG